MAARILEEILTWFSSVLECVSCLPATLLHPVKKGKKVMAGEGIIDCINALHKSWNIFIKAHTLLPFLYS